MPWVKEVLLQQLSLLMAYGVSHEGLFCFFIEKNTEACLSWIFARFKKENIMKNFREMKILLNLINFWKISLNSMPPPHRRHWCCIQKRLASLSLSNRRSSRRRPQKRRNAHIEASVTDVCGSRSKIELLGLSITIVVLYYYIRLLAVVKKKCHFLRGCWGWGQGAAVTASKAVCVHTVVTMTFVICL